MTSAPSPPSSEAERSLETLLRWNGIKGWEREVRFHPSRRWRADFLWPTPPLIVEVEGGSFVSGRHTRGTSFEADCEKYAEAAILGYRVLRVTPRQIRDGRAVGWIRRALGVGE